MTRRMFDSSMYKNEKFSRMPITVRFLQIGMLNHADDQGRLKANPNHLRGDIFPDDEDITGKDIQKWLEIMVKNGTIILYTEDEKQYAQFVNWWKYQSLQYAQPSQFPRPDGWQDRIRRTATKGLIVTCNWVTVDGSLLNDTCDQDGNLLPKEKIKIVPPPETPSANHLNGSSDSPADSPERSGIDTILTKLNLNKTTTTTAPNVVEAKPESEPEPEAKSGSSGGGLPEKRNRRGDEEFARLCLKFEMEGFGTLTDLLAEQINALLNEHPVDWIADAMAVAVGANKRQINYVRGILVRWRADGRNTPSQPAANAQGKQLLTLKRWCLDRYNIDNPKLVADVPESRIYAEYEHYRQQQAH